MRNLIFFSCLTILFTSCQQPNDSNNPSSTDDFSSVTDSLGEINGDIKLRHGSVDTAQISHWLTNSILKDDLGFLNKNQRSYQLDAYDLNGDGNLEYFIGFTNDYFCGSGGCTYYLVGHDGQLISLFSVSRAPFYVLPSTTNGWSDLVINSNSGMRKLTFDGASYPTNPSVLPAFDDSIQTTDTLAILQNAKSYSF